MSSREKWDFGRFAKTFTTFNGVPFLGWLGRAETVKQPEPVVVDQGREIVLWSFELGQDEFARTWAPLDDVVMGGVSESTIKLLPDGRAVLSGVTSSANNGGFCSARTKNLDVPYDLNGYAGVVLRAKSSIGQRYKLILRDTDGWDATAWCKAFDLPKGKEVEVRIPFGDFIPVVRGNTLKGMKQPINKARIYSVQVLVSKYEYDGELSPNFSEGPFELEFGSIRAYK